MWARSTRKGGVGPTRHGPGGAEQGASVKLHQCAHSTKASCDCVSHVGPAVTEPDAETTDVSIDGVSAFDWFPRENHAQRFGARETLQQRTA